MFFADLAERGPRSPLTCWVCRTRAGGRLPGPGSVYAPATLRWPREGNARIRPEGRASACGKACAKACAKRRRRTFVNTRGERARRAPRRSGAEIAERGGGSAPTMPLTGRVGRDAGPAAVVLTEVDALGTLRPCAWGVPGLLCVSSAAQRAAIGHRNLRLFRLRRESAAFDTPDRVGRRRSRLALLHGTQKPEK